MAQPEKLVPKTPVITRVVHSNRIVHNDLELGPGTVIQRRGKRDGEERQLELTWIFRELSELKHLDTTRYTRVKLHQEGACKEYWFDERSEAKADDDKVIQPYAVTRLGRWILVEPDIDTIISMLRERGYLKGA